MFTGFSDLGLFNSAHVWVGIGFAYPCIMKEGFMASLKWFMAIFFMVSIASCQLQEPNIVGINSVNLSNGIDHPNEITLDVQIDNPNRGRLKVNDSQIRILVNDYLIGNASLEDDVIVHGKGVFPVELKVKVVLNEPVQSLVPKLSWAVISGQLDLKLEGTASGTANFLPFEMDIHYSRPITFSDIESWKLF